MLLTGFDAPIEQVMYLDSPLKEHTLLQAIARVNRTAEAKSYGLVVDYWGVSQSLQEALAIFSPSDIKGALEPKTGRTAPPAGPARRGHALLRLGAGHRNDLEQCVAVLEPEDVRAEFQVAFRRFSQSMDMLLPDPRALRVRRRPRLARARSARPPRPAIATTASTSPTAATRSAASSRRR